MKISKDFSNIIDRYRGEGPYLYIDGVKHIDAASGTFNLPLGYTNKRIANKLKAQIDRCSHLSSSYTRELSECILQKLRVHLPEEIDRIWLRDVSGSGAVECAIRMAQKATGRSGVMSLFMAHHGQSLATTAISGNTFRIKNFYVAIDGSIKIPAPPSVMAPDDDSGDVSRYPDLEGILTFGSNGKIACFILEPIMGNGENTVIPRAFYRYVRAFCRKHGIVLIADEVQTGFGRTGTFFASNGYAHSLDPDIIVFAKGAGGIGIPTAGVLMRKEMDVLEPYEHSSTSGANPLSLTALNESIDILEDGVVENVARNSDYLRHSLLSLSRKHADITGVRGIGYMFGFDTPSVEHANRIVSIGEKHQIILRGARYGKSRTLKVRPPLICGTHHIDEIIGKIDSCFTEVQQAS